MPGEVRGFIVVVGGSVLDKRQGSASGGGGRSGGASLPGRDTSSGRNFPIARAIHRLSKIGHLTRFRLSNTCWKL